ncbi:MAG: TetR/AcrR family transcriptional regulator [Thermoanaerobaculia bacterium]|nr:TetR/AcrR family transcriptional regulator [Thermoanaerobaculia bacterium]
MTVTATTAAERKRLRILEAASQCFARLGFAKTTVEDIAREAGVSKGLLYVHFEGKEGLLEAVLESTLEQWHDDNWEATRAAGPSVVAQLRTMHSASLDFAMKHPLLQRILKVDAMLVATIVEGPARRATERWMDELRELLRTGVERGEIRDDVDVGHIAEVFRLLHLGYLEHLFEGEWPSIHDPALIDAGARLLLEGIATRGDIS